MLPILISIRPTANVAVDDADMSVGKLLGRLPIPMLIRGAFIPTADANREPIALKVICSTKRILSLGKMEAVDVAPALDYLMKADAPGEDLVHNTESEGYSNS
jgi:hypothetical protein